MFAFKFEVHTKKCPIVQSAVHWHEHMPSALAATDQWPCRWRSAWTQPRQKLTAASDRHVVRASGQHFEQLINWNNCLSVERFCFYKDIVSCELRI